MAWRRAIVPAPSAALVGGELARRRQALKQVSWQVRSCGDHGRIFCPLRAKFHSHVSMSVCATTINLLSFCRDSQTVAVAKGTGRREGSGNRGRKVHSYSSVCLFILCYPSGQTGQGTGGRWIGGEERKKKGNCP